MAVAYHEDTVARAIIEGVAREAEAIRERAIRTAVEDFEKSLREKVLNISVNLTKFYDINRAGDNLTITVRTP